MPTSKSELTTRDVRSPTTLRVRARPPIRQAGKIRTEAKETYGAPRAFARCTPVIGSPGDEPATHWGKEQTSPDSSEATDPTETETLRERATELRDTIRTKEPPEDVQRSIEAQLEPDKSYVARSSTTAEDLPTTSFAGQHSTVLDVSSLADVTDAVLSLGRRSR